MEDFSRGLEKELTKYKKVPNPFMKARKWQLMFVSEDGKVVRIPKYKGIVISVIAVSIIVLMAILGVSFFSYKINNTNKVLLKKLEEEKAEVQKIQKKMENERLYFISRLTENDLEKKSSKKILGKTLSPSAKKKNKKNELSDALKTVEIKDLVIKRKDDKLDLRFIVANNLKRSRQVSGRLFVILKQNEDDKVSWLTKPPVLLRDGMPSLPSRGKYFSINRFKTERFMLPSGTSDGDFKLLGIYVYTEKGRLMFKGSYPIPAKPAVKSVKKKTEKKQEQIEKNSDKPEPAKTKKELTSDQKEKPAENKIDDADLKNTTDGSASESNPKAGE